MTNSTSTNHTLLDGAMQQFARHGFAKTSMSDIAKAASISRTSLYKHFPTKEDVFKALSGRINDRVYGEVVAAMRDSGPWDKRLLAIVHARVSWVYELLHASEFGRELVNEKNRVCGGDVLAANDRFESLIGDLLKANLGKRADSAALARVLIQSVNGVLEKAETKAGAEQSVSLLVGVFCKGLMKS
jgi:AcrR family transcriptional regulator